MVSGTSNLMLPCSTSKSKQLPHSKTGARLIYAVPTKSNDYKCSVGLRQNPSFLSLCSVLVADRKVQEQRVFCEVGVKCYTLYTLMLILKEAINAPSASTSASAPSLRGLR